jgi:hypothetical protein
MNPNSLMYDPNGTSEFDEWINNQDRKRMFNWGINTGLQFYLGGNNYGNMSNLDRAYYREYTSGMSGVKFTLAPVGAYVDFNNKSGYKSAYFLGGEIGVDLSDFVTLKGYYMQSLGEDLKDKFEFDYLGLMGVDFVGKLNVSRGIVPYISIGGGYLNATDDYRGENIGTNALPVYQTVSSGYFAKGGVGVEILVSTYIDLFGGANIMYSLKNNNTDIIDLVNSKQLFQHAMYNAGIRFKIGKRADIEAARERAFNNQFAPERAAYEKQIKDLEKDLLEAYKNNDTVKIKEVLDQRNQIEQSKKDDNLIRLTPKELESLIDQTINGVENENTPNIENRLERLEQLLIQMNTNNNSTSKTTIVTPQYQAPAPVYNEYSAVNDRLISEINQLKQQISEQNNQLSQLRNNNSNSVQYIAPVVPNTVVVPNTNTIVDPNTNTIITPNSQNTPQVEGAVLNYGLSTFIGANFGDATTFNFGIRGNYGFTNNPIIFMPELYIGLGEKNGFGISANAIYPFAMPNNFFTPYVGLGVGLNLIGGNTRFNPNFIGGVSYKLNRGSLFADYTVRGAFKNNQIALGYRFKL